MNGNSSANELPELQAPPIMSAYSNALSAMNQNKSQNDSYDNISNKSASHLAANASKSVKFKLDQKDSAPIAVDTKMAHQISQISPHQLATSLITGRQIKIRDMQRYEDGRSEKILEDGSVLTEFMNGTVKEVSADKRHVLVKFFNGDRKEMNQNAGTETYYYAQTNVTQVTYSDGLQMLKFPNGQVEKHYPNDTKEIIFPDKIVKFIYTDGSEESRLTNGTVIKVDANGDKLIEYTNGQREIHTKDFKRREYPDGSVKTVYANGISETRYANGRVRVKDEFGNIITDKKE
jgi:centromere protein J